MLEKQKEALARRIAGEITLSADPGKTMRKWREIFQIPQREIAKHLKIAPSTISDYELGRRKNPGVDFLRRFVDALIEIDLEKGGQIIERLTDEEKTDFYERYDFTMGITIEEFVKLIDGKVLTNQEVLKDTIYGYTIIDSLRVILEMPPEDYPKLYGGISQRAFIFLGVSTGRSPLVVIRVAPIKPKVVVFLKLDKIDPLAKKNSEREKIPIVATNLDISEIKERLRI
jgi:putative transcriptional regulator